MTAKKTEFEGHLKQLMERYAPLLKEVDRPVIYTPATSGSSLTDATLQIICDAYGKNIAPIYELPLVELHKIDVSKIKTSQDITVLAIPGVDGRTAKIFHDFMWMNCADWPHGMRMTQTYFKRENGAVDIYAETEEISEYLVKLFEKCKEFIPRLDEEFRPGDYDKNGRYHRSVLILIAEKVFGRSEGRLPLNKKGRFWKMFEAYFGNDDWRDDLCFFKTWRFETLDNVANFIVCRLW